MSVTITATDITAIEQRLWLDARRVYVYARGTFSAVDRGDMIQANKMAKRAADAVVGMDGLFESTQTQVTQALVQARQLDRDDETEAAQQAIALLVRVDTDLRTIVDLGSITARYAHIAAKGTLSAVERGIRRRTLRALWDESGEPDGLLTPEPEDKPVPEARSAAPRPATPMPPPRVTPGQLRELEALAKGPQPAYVGHGNRARSGVQNKLVLDHEWARYLPTCTEAETVEITTAGREALAVLKAERERKGHTS